MSHDATEDDFRLDSYIVQFVCFETSLPPTVFQPIWIPFATNFLSQGIESLILNEKEGDGNLPYRYISKNWWPSERFEAAFPRGKMAGSPDLGFVKVKQAGGFRATSISAGKPPLDPRRLNTGMKLLVTGKGNYPRTEDRASIEAEYGFRAAFLYQSLPGTDSPLFDWLIELYGLQTGLHPEIGGTYTEVLHLPK